MSDEWVWQGFFGPTNVALEAKLTAEQLPPTVVGVIIPPPGAGVVAVDVSGEMSMYAVQTRSSNPLPVPDNLEAARSEIVGRLVGA